MVDTYNSHNKEPNFRKPFRSPFTRFLPIYAALVILFVYAIANVFDKGRPFSNSVAAQIEVSDITSASRPHVSFEDVAGIDSIVDELKKVCEFIKYPEKYKALGARLPRGILLTGAPGCGKTLIAKAIAGETGCHFIALSGSDFEDASLGVGAARVYQIFQEAKKNKPCIIFIDEIDSMMKEELTKHTVNELLVQMDGMSTEDGILVIAATNHPEDLDPAFLRPGRVDTHLKIPFPDEKARHAILKTLSKKFTLDPLCELHEIATMAAGFSGAHLESLLNEAAILAATKNQPAITQPELIEAVKKVKSQNSLLQADKKVTLRDVAGIDDAVAELQEVVDFLKEPTKYSALGARLPKGILLMGPPGTGKTLIAKAIANETGCHFISQSGSSFINEYVGVGAKNVRKLFEEAKVKAPCIIFIDELDSIGRERTKNSGDSGNQEYAQTLMQLLVEMDGFQSASNIVVIGATNHPELLDKALLRPGRFDKQIIILPPDEKGRLDILKVHAKKFTLGSACDLQEVAKVTPGATGAHLENILNESALIATRKKQTFIAQDDLLEAVDKVLIGKLGRKIQLDDYEKMVTAYHEAGHAIIANLVNEDFVSSVTIKPHGMTLGHTKFAPKSERLTFWKSELVDQLAIMLGGRASEEIFFEDISSGAKDDIEQATAFAHDVVRKWGLSDRLGPTSYDHKSYSGKTAEEIDQEVRRLVSEGYKKALQLIRKEYVKVELCANALIEFETLNQQDVQSIVSGTFSAEEKRTKQKLR